MKLLYDSLSLFSVQLFFISFHFILYRIMSFWFGLVWLCFAAYVHTYIYIYTFDFVRVVSVYRSVSFHFYMFCFVLVVFFLLSFFFLSIIISIVFAPLGSYLIVWLFTMSSSLHHRTFCRLCVGVVYTCETFIYEKKKT